MPNRPFDERPDDDGPFTDENRETIARPLEVERFQPLSAEARIDVAAASACGKLQRHNSDHYLAIRLGRLQETMISSLPETDLPPRFEEYGYAMLVADGLGAEGVGVRASRVALSALAHLAIRYGKWNVRVTPQNTPEIEQQLGFLYRRVHDALTRARRADFKLADMATSITAVYIAGGSLFYAHVGHSRAFLFRNGGLTQLTTDHTEQRRPETPRVRQSKRDLTHIITETVGGRLAAPDVALEHFHLWPGDRVLLCTNGLTDVVGEDRIADVLAARRRPKDDCRQLIDLALAAGGPDNVTVMVGNYSYRSVPLRAETHEGDSDVVALSPSLEPQTPRRSPPPAATTQGDSSGC